MRLTRVLSVLAFALLAVSFQAVAEHHETGEQAAPAAKPWDQQAVTDLSATFAKDAAAAYTAIYTQSATSGQVGGSRRGYARLKDKARMIQREARHLKAELEGGKDHDDTLPVVERLMVEVRDIRVIGRRLDIQQMTRDKIAAAGASLRGILAYYDPAMFDAGDAPPLSEQKR